MRIYILLGILVSCVAAASPLSQLSNARMSDLVRDLNAYYGKSLESLYASNRDETERQLGLRVAQELLAGYEPRLAGRCTKMLLAQTLQQFIQIAAARMRTPSAELATGYEALLASFGLKLEDLRKTGDCEVFEYDLEPLYESPVTVHDPGFWPWTKNRQIHTYIRFYIREQKEDGTVVLEGYIPEGSPRGVYAGVARRDLHSTSIQVSLLRKGEPLLIDGELTMSGAAFRDPLTREPAPKMPARALSGILTVHDGEDHAVNEAILAVARDSDEKIGKSLNGLKIPVAAPYGTYLNALLVRYEGPGVEASFMKLTALVDDAYAGAQKDNPLRSFHPTRKPLFLRPGEVAFLALDVASDVNARAARVLRSRCFVNAAGRLGAKKVYVVPFYKIEDGKLTMRLPGRPEAKVNFDGFEGLSRSLFGMFSALGQEQLAVFERFGVRELSERVRAMEKDVGGVFQWLGPALDRVLEGVPADAELDAKLTAAMEALRGQARQLMEILATVLDTRETDPYLKLFGEYTAGYRAILEAAALANPASLDAAAREKRAALVSALVSELVARNGQASERARKFAEELREKRDAVAASLGFMNAFSLRLSLSGKYVEPDGKLSSWTWEFDRVMPKRLEGFYTGRGYGKAAVTP